MDAMKETVEQEVADIKTSAAETIHTGETKKQKDDLLQLVGFNLGSEEFGLDILQVQEINRPMEITRIPQAPDFVEGIINLRGKVIPVISLRKRFELPELENNVNTRIVVVEIKGKVVGFIVDSVSEVIRISKDIIEPPSSIVMGMDTEYIAGVCKLKRRLLILLDMEKILTSRELSMLKKAK
jgi:purine-binding chemotaxis protein CheW